LATRRRDMTIEPGGITLAATSLILAALLPVPHH
jgi:hypothetical protein